MRATDDKGDVLVSDGLVDGGVVEVVQHPRDRGPVLARLGLDRLERLMKVQGSAVIVDDRRGDDSQ